MYIMLPIMLAVRIGNDKDRKYLEKLYNETYRALVSYADSILQCREVPSIRCKRCFWR